MPKTATQTTPAPQRVAHTTVATSTAARAHGSGLCGSSPSSLVPGGTRIPGITAALP